MSKYEPRVLIKKSATQIDFFTARIKTYAGNAITKVTRRPTYFLLFGSDFGFSSLKGFFLCIFF